MVFSVYKSLTAFLRGRENIIIIIFLFFLSVGMCWPLFRDEFPTTHDYINSLMKHLAMQDFFGRGQFLPVWVPDYYYGYGGAVFNFYPPLFSFLSACLGWLGLASALAINLTSFLVIFLSAWAMFIFLKELTGRAGAFLGAAAYMMAPYHTVDLYLRGAHSELTAFVFMPLILWGIWKEIKGPSFFYFWVTALSVAGLALSHGTTAIFFLPMAVVYSVFLGITHNGIRCWYRTFPLAAILTGIALAAFFVLPALFENKYLDSRRFLGGQFDYRGNFLHLFHLFLSSDQRAFLKLPVGSPAVPCQLGLMYILSGLAGIVCAWIFMPREVKRVYIFLLFLLLFTMWMMTSSSRVIWEWFPVLGSMQFPWRLLAPLSLFICSFIACLGRIPNEKYRRLICILGIICVMFTRMPDFRASGWVHWPASGSSRSLRTIGIGALPRDFQPLSAKHELTAPPDHVMDFFKGTAEIISHQQRSPVAHTFEVQAQTPAMACFYNYYFLGWEIHIDGQKASFLDNEYGLMLFFVPPGKHHIDIRFVATPVRMVGAWISALCLIGMIVVPICRKFSSKIPSEEDFRQI